MPCWADIARDISAATGSRFKLRTQDAVAGGCINTAYCIADGSQRYFVKVNQAAAAGMFAAEAAALAAIDATHTVRVPRPLCAGANATHAWLVLEYIELFALDAASAGALGAALAALHRVTNPTFGWDRDNTIGSTPQPNPPAKDWTTFWREQRLGHQLGLAARTGFGGALQRDGERLLARLDAFFAGHAPRPSLLHGDLWSGNAARDADGRPVVFDPASYYGDREADIAMTELFGRYPAPFYSTYGATYALDPGYASRKPLYNLYHVLNHLNLFGDGYLRQAEALITRLLAEV